MDDATKTRESIVLLEGLAANAWPCRIYLQVQQDNAGAVSLYARAGFFTLYAYHYREEPVG